MRQRRRRSILELAICLSALVFVSAATDASTSALLVDRGPGSASEVPLELVDSVVCMGFNFRLDIAISQETRKILDVSHLYMVPADVIGTRGGKGGTDFFEIDVPSKEQTTFATILPDSLHRGSLYYETVDLLPSTIYSAMLCEKQSHRGEFYRQLRCGYRVDVVTHPGSERKCLTRHAWSIEFLPIQIVNKFPRMGVAGIITSYATVGAINLLVAVESETRAIEEDPALTSVKFETDEGGLRFDLHLTSTEPKWGNPGWCNISVGVRAGTSLADMKFLKRKGAFNIQVTSTVSPMSSDVSYELLVDEHCSVPALRSLKKMIEDSSGDGPISMSSLSAIQQSLQDNPDSENSFEHIAAAAVVNAVRENLFIGIQQLFRSLAGYMAQNPCFQRQMFSNVQDHFTKVKFGLGVRYRVKTDSKVQFSFMSPMLSDLFGGPEAANKAGFVMTVNPEPDNFKVGYNPEVQISGVFRPDIFEPILMRFASPYTQEKLQRLVDRLRAFVDPILIALDTPEFVLNSFHCGPKHPFWTCNLINKKLKATPSSATGFYLTWDPTSWEPSTFHYVPLIRLADAQIACADIMSSHAMIDVNKHDEEQAALLKKTLDLANTAVATAKRVVATMKKKINQNALAAMQAKGGGGGSDEADDANEGADADVDDEESFLQVDEQVQHQAPRHVGSASGSSLDWNGTGLHNWTLEWVGLRNLFTPLNGTGVPFAAFITGQSDAPSFDMRIEFNRMETELEAGSRQLKFMTGDHLASKGRNGTAGLDLRMTLVALDEEPEHPSHFEVPFDDESDPTQLELTVSVPPDQEIVTMLLSKDSKDRVHLQSNTGSFGNHVKLSIDWKKPRNIQWLRKYYPDPNAAKKGQKKVLSLLNSRFLPRLIKRIESFAAELVQYFAQHPCMQRFFMDHEDLQAGSGSFNLRLLDGVVHVDLGVRDAFAKLLNKKIPWSVRPKGLQVSAQYLGSDTLFCEAATGASHIPLKDWSALAVSLPELISYGLLTQASSRTASALSTSLELYGNFTPETHRFWRSLSELAPFEPYSINRSYAFLDQQCESRAWSNLVSALQEWHSGKPRGKDLASLERRYAEAELNLANVRIKQHERIDTIQHAHGALRLSAPDLMIQQRRLVEAIERVKAVAHGKYSADEEKQTPPPKTKALTPLKIVKAYQRRIRAHADLKNIMAAHERLILIANTKFAVSDKKLLGLLKEEFTARGHVIQTALDIDAKYNSLWPYIPALLPKKWTDSHLAKTVIAQSPPQTPFNASVKIMSDCYYTVTDEYTVTGACVNVSDCAHVGWAPIPWSEGAVGCLRWLHTNNQIRCCVDHKQLTKQSVAAVHYEHESGEHGHHSAESMSHIRFAAQPRPRAATNALQP